MTPAATNAEAENHAVLSPFATSLRARIGVPPMGRAPAPIDLAIGLQFIASANSAGAVISVAFFEFFGATDVARILIQETIRLARFRLAAGAKGRALSDLATIRAEG
jgi:hypothetical protein